MLGSCGLIDEAKLLDIVSIKTIKELERDEVKLERHEPVIGRRQTIPDGEALSLMKTLISKGVVERLCGLGRTHESPHSVLQIRSSAVTTDCTIS